MTSDHLFPYDSLRPVQDKLFSSVKDALCAGRCLIVHAPTGLGKTAATLAPALKYALDEKKTVFFITSRLTQHKLAMDTLSDIKKKHGCRFCATDIIGKKWMCVKSGVASLRSGEFNEYCKTLRNDDACEFYINTRTKDNRFTVQAKSAVEELMEMSPLDPERIKEICNQEGLCPYEISLLMAANSQVIVTDYHYIFNPTVSSSFFGRIKKEMADSVIVADEGHNLPSRIRDLMTVRMSNIMLSRAIKEAKRNGFDDTHDILTKIYELLMGMAGRMQAGAERLIPKPQFYDEVDRIKQYDLLLTDLNLVADEIREKHKLSYIGSIASFLEQWPGEDEGYVRILNVRYGGSEPIVTLSYQCMDPSIISSGVINASYCTVLMSGTLSPTAMYKDLLGFPANTEQKVFSSPFPMKNRLNLVIPKTSTKYSERSPAQFMQIAKICADICNAVPGNSAIFFPSYLVRDAVNKYFQDICNKTVFLEISSMSKYDRDDMLDRFKEYKEVGAVLLGVAAGSFGEGVDLPGDLLKAVIVVGLPLNVPDLETKELIRYYDNKFGKGWDYGYIMPAITKTLQNAGRCIRSETDKGVIVFLDERYSWPRYMGCFPADWQMKISREYLADVHEFFAGNRSSLL